MGFFAPELGGELSFKCRSHVQLRNMTTTHHSDEHAMGTRKDLV